MGEGDELAADAAADALRGASLGPRPVRLPVPGERNVLVTSALPYVNNIPHLGNIIGCVLSADVYARYCRRRGYNVIYICGTDEYGTATETKALEEGTTPQAICDKYHAIHKDIYEWFDVDFDKFGRTSTLQQTTIAQAIFTSLHKKGRLIEDTMEQLYCDTCSRFLADRFVWGTCPFCHFEDARGDQCDNCGKLLNASELKEPHCKICGMAPRVRQTEHMFLDLPALENQLQQYVASTSIAGGWSANSVQTTNAWIRDGLKPRCITRDLKWGVPVPLEKYKDKVFYVWFDAPIGYLSITANYTDEWERWWRSPSDVELVQFMGKDNIPFHTVIFPCTLLGTEEPWTLLKTISVTEYLNYEGGKQFSKSRGTGIFGNDAKATGIPVEIWRYYLLTNRPEVSDTAFDWNDLQAKVNNELLANLGNFVNRCLSFLAKTPGKARRKQVSILESGCVYARMTSAEEKGCYSGVVPEASNAGQDELTAKLGKDVGKAVTEYVECMEKVKLKAGLKVVMSISSLGNAYLQSKKPWDLLKEEGGKSKCDIVMRTAVGLVQLLATLCEPFMPSVSYKILLQLVLPMSSLSLSDFDVERASRPWEIVPLGHVIGKSSVLFTALSKDEVEALRDRFKGGQADRLADEAKTAAAALKTKGATADKKEAPDAKKKSSTSSGGVKKDEGPVDISRLDLRVGQIKSVQKHPDADSLYVEEIDLGSGEVRTVVSGLVKFVPIEEMQGRKVCLLCNLKPATMRGIKSHAMVLAASNADHTQVELVNPPEGSKVGERILIAGFEGEPDVQLNPKKKVWETVQVDLRTSADLVAAYKGTPLSTSAGICTVTTLSNASIG
eukprot:SM000213S06827  [mRNA]  locus=s213:191328:197704:- [translate_table: standard]